MDWLKEFEQSMPSNFNREEHDEKLDQLNERREQFYASLGEVSENVIARDLEIYDEPELFLWPSSALGMVEIIRREKTVLFVTNGISDPWDVEMHGEDPEGLFGFEAGIEVPLADFDDTSDEGLLGSWAPQLLFAATDPYISERIDIMGAMDQFGLTTIGIPPVGTLERYLGEENYMLGLMGFPFLGDSPNIKITEFEDEPISLLMIKLLTPDEATFALINDFENARELLAKFMSRGDKHFNWLERPSVLKEPMLKTFPGL